MKWLVGSGDSKAAETQTAWPRVLSPGAFLTTKLSQAQTCMEENATLCAACAGKIQDPNSVRKGLAVKEGWRHRVVTGFAFPMSVLCRNNQVLQEHRPAQLAWLQDCSVSSFPYPSGRCGPNLFLFAGFFL